MNDETVPEQSGEPIADTAIDDDDLDDDFDGDAVEDDEPQLLMTPPVASLGERGYRIVFVRPAEDGTITIDPRALLPARVYDRRVAVRYAQHEAKHMAVGANRALLALLDPAGRLIGVYQAGSGRPAPLAVVRAVRRALGTTRRKTSRAPRPTGRPVSRKTSRRIGRGRTR